LIQFDTEIQELKISGSAASLIVESASLLNSIYNSLLDEGAEYAAEYKKRLCQMTDDIFISKEELSNRTEAAMKAMAIAPESFHNLIDMLFNRSGSDSIPIKIPTKNFVIISLKNRLNYRRVNKCYNKTKNVS